MAVKTVQITLNEDFAAQVDATIEKLGKTRSAFICDALQAAMLCLEQRDLERKHREGYRKKPVRKGEFPR
jgi:metal-responsive CopG/Arc/MetJ family transcriptional regulator